MKLFERTGGYYLFWVSAIYLSVGMYEVFVNHFLPIELIQVAWISVLALPFICPPFGRYINLDVTWDQKMFNMFGKKGTLPNNVVKFPDHREYGIDDKQALPLPQAEPPKKEEPAKIYYRLGLTDNNRVAFSMHYAEITMNKAGCQQMIDQLRFFQRQLADDDNPGGGPDGGEPIPVPEEETEIKSKKAA